MSSNFSLQCSSDLETGTSSDIEVISLASTYGDVNGDRINDFVPLSRSLFKTKMRDLSPEEEISPNSSQHSPGSDRDESAVKEPAAPAPTDPNNPLGVENLIKVKLRACLSCVVSVHVRMFEYKCSCVCVCAGACVALCQMNNGMYRADGFVVTNKS